MKEYTYQRTHAKGLPVDICKAPVHGAMLPLQEAPRAGARGLLRHGQAAPPPHRACRGAAGRRGVDARHRAAAAARSPVARVLASVLR